MTALGLWFAFVGSCDLVRAGRDATSLRRRVVLLGLGSVLALVLGVSFAVPWWLILVWLGCLSLWVLASATALAGDSRAGRALSGAGLAAGSVVSLISGGLVDPPGRLAPGPLGELSPETSVLVLGIALVQLATANIVVRLVLDAVGVPAVDNEKSLKGGRLLGPMERLLVLGLGVAGELTAAGIVVAAKGLLRFPELSRGARAGPSDLTEYFLIGSFSSWLVALGGVALAGM